MMSTTRKDPKGQSKEPLRCWFVEIPLKGGEGLQFYVTAINEHEAYKKADTYAEIAKNESMAKIYKGRGFTLLP